MLKTSRRPWRPWRCLNVLCTTLERPRQPFCLPSAFNGDLDSFVVARGRHRGRSPCVKGVLGKYTGILNKLKRYLPVDILRILCRSMAESHFNYAILAWDLACTRLNKLQKRIMRTIMCNRYNAHTLPLFKSLRLLTLDDMLKVWYGIQNAPQSAVLLWAGLRLRSVCVGTAQERP